jgi:hypothetical protein
MDPSKELGAVGGEDMEATDEESLGEMKISLNEKKLLEAFRALHIEPFIENPDDLRTLLRDAKTKEFGEELKIKKETTPLITIPKTRLTTNPMATPGTETKPTENALLTPLKDLSSSYLPDISITTSKPAFVWKTPGQYHFPKLSNFYGEENKGEVTWETFKFEIESLITDNMFTEEHFLLGIRRAVKGRRYCKEIRDWSNSIRNYTKIQQYLWKHRKSTNNTKEIICMHTGFRQCKYLCFKT